MPARQVNRLFGQIASARGRTNEERVLDACTLASRPEWMRASRRATRREDASGIDVVIESDVGKLYVQVKSSRTGKEAFLDKRRGVRAVVVVVRNDDTADALLRKVVGELGKLRAAYLKERAGRS